MECNHKWVVREDVEAVDSLNLQAPYQDVDEGGEGVFKRGSDRL